MHPRAARALTGTASATVLAGVAVSTAAPSSGDLVISVLASFAVTTGWVVVARDPTSPIGPALAWSGAGTAAVAVVDAVAGTARSSDPLPLAAAAEHLGIGSWPVNLVGLFALLLVFPDGPRPGRLWSALPWTYAAACLGEIYAQWDSRQVDGKVVGDMSGTQVVAAVGSTVLVGGCLVLAVARLVLTYRDGAERMRQQMRWLLLSGAFVVVLLVAGNVAQAIGESSLVVYVPFLVALAVLVPSSVVIAVLRHDLFDVDRLLSDTASWLVTVVLSSVVFAAVVAALSQVLSRTAPLGPATAAFLTALTVLPLHRRLSTWVGRLVDPDRYTALAAVQEFSADVRAGRREPEEIEAVLREAQGDPGLRLILAGPDGWVTLDGRPATLHEGFSVRSGGDEIARIVLTWDSARARRRVAELAQASWVSLEVSRLRMALRGALDEATAAQARLAAAAADERRRLERDLHDGAQQRLLAVGMRLRLLERGLPPGQAEEVCRAVGDLQDTVDELRRIAHGVRPDRLDDGLEAALASMRESSPLPFGLVVEELPALDDARALTAYLVVNEAVTNALKHAEASRVDVLVQGRGEALAVRVSDDGVGGVPADAPLHALRDRVLSVGGSVRVQSIPGVGTTIEAVL